MAKSTRVAIIQSETRIIGGIERITESLLRYRNWQEVELYAVFLRPGRLLETIGSFFPPERMWVCDAGRLRQLPRTGWTIVRIARQLRKWGVGVTLSQGFHSQCYGGPAAALAGAKNIFWCHAIVEQGSRRDVTLRTAFHTPAEMVLANSRVTQDSLAGVLRPRTAVEVVYPGIDLDGKAESNGFRHEFGIPEGVPVVTVVGRLQEWKGQDVFVRAAALLNKRWPETRFVVVGGLTFSRDAEYERRLHGMAAELGIAERVLFTGHRDDVSAILRSSDIAVHTSKAAEPFGMVVAEAMAAGKPVIATGPGGPAEVVEEGVSGFVIPPSQPEVLAERINALLGDGALRARMGEAGCRRARERFTTGRMVAGLEHSLRRIQ